MTRSGSRSAQQGVALITALLVVALAALIASGMLSSQNVGIHRSGNILAADQAWWYAIGAENWAGTVLKRDAEDNNYDDLSEPWSQALDFLPVEGGFLSGGLIDLQGRFNLNNLSRLDPQEASAQLESLLQTIEGIEAGQAPALTQGILDWIDADIEASFPDGAEDDYYLGLPVPYRTANQPMFSPSELLLIRDMTPEIYRALLPYVSTLPAPQPINVNTAAPQVLATLSPDLTPENLQAILDAREQQPFQTLDDFLALEAVAGIGLDPDAISVSSQFFLMEAVAQIGNTRSTLYSVLRRDTEGKVVVYRRTRDSL